METEQNNKLQNAQTPEQLLELLEEYEYSLDSKVRMKPIQQLFAYILNWDLVNARFFYYKYKTIFDVDIIGKEIVKFLQLLYEQKYSEWTSGCNRLCELIQKNEFYNQWVKELRQRVQKQLDRIVYKNFQSISASRLNTFNMKSNGQRFVQIEQQNNEDQTIDIEKLTQVARLIQKMNIQ